MLGILLAQLPATFLYLDSGGVLYFSDSRLDIIPEYGEALTAQVLDLFDFLVQQIYLFLVAVLDIQPGGNSIEESDLVFLTGFNQLLDIFTLVLSVEISPE